MFIILHSSLFIILSIVFGLFLFGAIIQYSALVNRIKGKISSSVISNWKGLGVVKRHNASPHQGHSAKQQEVRGNMSDLAGEYYSLSDGAKELWKSYSVLLKDPMTPLNAYVGSNARLLKYFPGIARMSGPPVSPSTPAFLKDLSITALAAGDFCVFFTGPTLSGLTAIVDYWAMPGLDMATNPRWTFGASAACSALKVIVPLAYPVGTIVKFRSCSLDSSARVSPWSQILVAISLT